MNPLTTSTKMLLTNSVINTLKSEGQRAWYGVARDYVMDNDDLVRSDSLEDERKGYKYDEVADIRSLLDQFMTTTAADKALACFKSSTAKSDEWNRLEVPDNQDILLFFRTRSLDAPPPPAETIQEEAAPEPPQEQTYSRFTAPRGGSGTRSGVRYASNQPAQTSQSKQVSEDIHKDPQAQGDYRAQITGKSTRRTLLQELTAKLKKQEAAAQHLNNPHSRYPRQRKYYDSADYP